MGQLNFQRREIQREGMKDLLRRNKIQVANVGLNGYLLQESTRVGSEGTETTKYQLFKLVDQEVVTLSIDINKKTESGTTQKDQLDGVRETANNQATQSSI